MTDITEVIATCSVDYLDGWLAGNPPLEQIEAALEALENAATVSGAVKDLAAKRARLLRAIGKAISAAESALAKARDTAQRATIAETQEPATPANPPTRRTP